MSHKAFQYRIYPDKNQEIWLKHQFGCARFVYNYFLEKHTEIYENTDANMSYTKDNKLLNFLKSLKRNPSKILKNLLKTIKQYSKILKNNKTSNILNIPIT